MEYEGERTLEFDTVFLMKIPPLNIFPHILPQHKQCVRVTKGSTIINYTFKFRMTQLTHLISVLLNTISFHKIAKITFH